jgi:hypothetical protein
MTKQPKRSRAGQIAIGGVSKTPPLFDDAEAAEPSDDKKLLTTLANSQDGLKQFRQKFRGFSSYGDKQVLKLRDDLREVWRIPADSSEIIQEWLDSEPALRIAPDPYGGGFTLSPQFSNLPGRLVFAIIRASNMLAVCENPDCPAPFFVAVKAVQRYCSSSCAAPAKRAAKMRWWRRNRSRNAIVQRRSGSTAGKSKRD